MRDERRICMLGYPSRSYPGRQASWIHFDGDDSMEFNEKIHSAFDGVKSFPFKRIIFQFWRPLADDRGRLVLECTRNAYASSPFDRLLRGKYRTRCMKYQYRVDEGIEGVNQNPAWIITGGPVATAFLNHFPEVVPDLRVHQGSPLAVCALECELTCCVMLPVFHAGGSSECLGVVECSMKHPGLLLPMFYELKHELERVGMSVYHLQGTWPYKTISGDLEAAKIEIERALEMASESHALTLGQVWIPYESSITCRETFLVKLSAYSLCSAADNPIKDFYDKFDVVSGEGLAWKTVQTHQPHLCRNICKLSVNKGVLALLSSANSKSRCASFVICLRSSHTGDLDYAFEFFWPHDRNHFILIETLFLTLSKYLPSFKSASGEELGDESFVVVDVDNSSSTTPVKFSETKTLVGAKRKSVDDDNDGNDEDDDDDVAILAAYRNRTLLFYLPSSSTFETIMEILKNEFELDPAQTYKVECEVVPGRWSSLTCLASCPRMEDTGLVKLRVLANRNVSLRWITNSS